MILVIGATGNVGSKLVKQLATMGQQVRALVRHPEKATLIQSLARLLHSAEQATNSDGSGTGSQHIGNPSHDTETPAQVCWKQVMRTG